MSQLTRVQTTSLILLRTLIGWHFLYEGYYKLALPGWSTAGSPLAPWSATGYLKAATGPLAPWFHALAASSASGWIDVAVPIALALIGLSLTLGLLTQAGASGALILLTLFYAAAVPLDGVPRPGAEGTYLVVNKTLIEWGAVLVVLVFRTGRLAGLDLLWSKPRVHVEERVTGPERLLAETR
jgi:thiosulfate dehydrogenase [quinone] large subunit